MAGLCAAARVRELGADSVVLEKGSRIGGSMLLSSCVVWRYRTFELFRRQCPGGDPALQRALFEALDDGLGWLESLGAPVVTRDTGNPMTVGVRFEPRGLTHALARAAGAVRLETPLGDPGHEAPVVLATGGFQGDRGLVARFVTPEAEGLWLRANPWSAGDGLRFALARGGALSSGLDEFYGRNLPAPPARDHEAAFVELAQLYGRHALVVDERGREFGPDPPSWSEADLVQATARRPGARAWYIVDAAGMRERVRERAVAEMVAAAEGAGGTVHRAATPGALAEAAGLPALPPSPKLREPPFAAVHVAAGITHTIGGVRVDERARVLRGDGGVVEGLLACGADAGGVATGGYASGLAAALVLGRIAAEEAVSLA